MSTNSSITSGARSVARYNCNTNRLLADLECDERPPLQRRASEPNITKTKKKPIIRCARRKSVGDETRGKDCFSDSPRSSVSSLGGSKTIKYKGRRKSRRKSTRRRKAYNIF